MWQRISNWWANLNELYKRGILIITFSLSVFILSFLIYFVFFRIKIPEPGAPVTPTPGVLPPTTLRDILRERGIPIEEIEEEAPVLPEALERPSIIAEGGMTLATPQVYIHANDPSIGKTGNINYYNDEDGKFYTLGSDGTKRVLSPKSFPNVQDTTWSPEGNKAVLEFPDGSNVFYDFDQDRQYTLPKEGEGFNFSTTGNQLGYRFITGKPEENWLIISNPTGDNTIAVEHIGDANPEDVLINWSPDGSKVALFRESAGLETEEVFFIGKNQENFKSLAVSGRGFEGLWSPKGDKLIYSMYNSDTGYRPELWVTDARDESLGINAKNLGLRTWVNKCIFAGDNTTVYCAVPLYLEQGVGIYPELAQTIPDTIYKINLATGFKQQIAIPTNSLGLGLYTAEKLMLSPDEKTLHIVDTNGGIYKIQLK